MRKFFIVLFLCVLSTVAFGEPTYNCRYQSENTNKRGRLEKNGEYLYCGHVGTDGCANMDKVVIDDTIYTCSGHNWIIADYVNPCPYASHGDMLRVGYEYYKNGDNYIYYKRGNDTETLVEYCKMYTLDMKNSCLESGGAWAGEIKVGENFVDGNYCECQHDGTMLVGVHCECQTGLEMDENKECWPQEYVDGKCAEYAPNMFVCVRNGIKRWRHEKYNNAEFYFINNGDCWMFCIDGCNRYCGVADKIYKKNNLACPGVDESIARRAYSDNNYIIDKDNEGLECIKPKSQYNYQTCSNDNDCKNIDNTKRPYLHSTSWKCIEQTAGVRVCAARECESGWEPKNGYCQEKNSGPAAAEKSAKPANGQTGTPAGAATSRSAGAKNCPDANMDADCRCTRVPETVERGGVCVCADSNKEIKNGKCEYTAGYVAKLGADVNNAYDGVKSIVDGLKLNVWRDADGNFNTARLASDSIAGVVLGTVGGIVTANVVKKSQVKKGFEDIQCHIGGQSVANFGDGFIVGR